VQRSCVVGEGVVIRVRQECLGHDSNVGRKMSEPSGLTAEMYRAVVTLVDDRMREIRVTRQDFDDLKGVVLELAQARTERRRQERRRQL